jgi:hypothetical protein
MVCDTDAHRVFGVLQRTDEQTARMSGKQTNWARLAPRYPNVLSAKLQALDTRVCDFTFTANHGIRVEYCSLYSG